MADFTEVNRAHWNKTAATYNSSNEKTIQELIKQVQKRKDFIGVDWVEDSDSEDDNGDGESLPHAPTIAKSSDPDKTVRLLDYACGTGMISRALGPYITSATGMDLSENMASTYNTLASNQGLRPTEMHAVVGNLLNPSSPRPAHLEKPEFFNFDVAAVGLGFHHFEDPIFAAAQLGRRLKTGGVLFLVDFVTHEPHGSTIGGGHSHHHHHHGHSHSHRHGEEEKTEKSPENLTDKEKQIAATVKHFGFSEEEMKRYFEEAGVGRDFNYQVFDRDVVFKMETRTMTRKVFICRGTKV